LKFNSTVKFLFHLVWTITLLIYIIVRYKYAEIMNNLNLPNPKLMDMAIPKNLKLGEK